jgi:hypothetical protein
MNFVFMSNAIMKENLLHLLYQYISDNNPDVLVGMENEAGVTDYLNEKLSAVTLLLSREGIPDHIMEEESMELLTADLKPSRYLYIAAIFEDEFLSKYVLFQMLGVLQFEIINMISNCNAVFDSIGFTEDNEDDNYLRYCIISAIGEYLDSNSENEIVKHELQQRREISR